MNMDKEYKKSLLMEIVSSLFVVFVTVLVFGGQYTLYLSGGLTALYVTCIAFMLLRDRSGNVDKKLLLLRYVIILGTQWIVSIVCFLVFGYHSII